MLIGARRRRWAAREEPVSDGVASSRSLSMLRPNPRDRRSDRRKNRPGPGPACVVSGVFSASRHSGGSLDRRGHLGLFCACIRPCAKNPIARCRTVEICSSSSLVLARLARRWCWLPPAVEGTGVRGSSVAVDIAVALIPLGRPLRRRCSETTAACPDSRLPSCREKVLTRTSSRPKSTR